MIAYIIMFRLRLLYIIRIPNIQAPAFGKLRRTPSHFEASAINPPSIAAFKINVNEIQM